MESLESALCINEIGLHGLMPGHVTGCSYLHGAILILAVTVGALRSSP
jgi:hypothetical protein